MEKQSVRVLIVDDNSDSSDTLAALARAWGYEVAVAYDGISGMVTAQQFLPDVMLLDLWMPKLEGFSFARQVRHDDTLSGSILAAVTGVADLCSRRKCKESGFDFHAAKPVDPDRLQCLLMKIQDARNETQRNLVHQTRSERKVLVQKIQKEFEKLPGEAQANLRSVEDF